MPVSCDDWMKALGHVSDAENLKITVKGSMFGSFLIGIIAFVFSLLLGPVGLLFGGIIGSCFAFFKMWGAYKPLSSVLKELTPDQKEKLYSELAQIRANITAQDYVELMLLLQGHGGLLVKKQVLNILVGFVKNTFSLDVK
ncbi:protein C19orf12 homolog [Hydractinia symbiolongicarpus]|uniref:protein C19orf12 homolog n=1 Tax=Hydractinia symbiolongicarpus TaxID=13093 RepID=UPI00254EEBED|nr:protein C19orf12 homolog [Hydractinia symbiolongicarpus]